MFYGLCFMVYGLLVYVLLVDCLWFMVYGLCFMVYGLWFIGLWFMVYGLWFMALVTKLPPKIPFSITFENIFLIFI